MGWYLYDANGYVGDLASNNGLASLQRSLENSTETIADFFNEGWTNKLDDLKNDLSQEELKNNDDQQTLNNLIELIEHCEEIAIISDGLEEDDKSKVLDSYLKKRTKDAEFKEEDHPRGQPNNKGQFVKKSEKTTETTTQAEAWKDKIEADVKDGWYIHGRRGTDDLLSEFKKHEIFVSKEADVAEDYAGNKGSIWQLRPKKTANILDATDDIQRTEVVDRLKEQYESGDLNNGAYTKLSQEIDDEIESYGEDKAWERISESLNPKDIVEDEGFYSDTDFVNWLYENFEYDFVSTNRGGVAYNPDAFDLKKFNPNPSHPLEEEKKTKDTIFDRFLKRKTKDSLLTMSFQGLPIVIENPIGSLRKHQNGVTKMFYPYGYIKKTVGRDGDEIDCFIGPNEKATNVFIVKLGKDDKEDKVMMGFDDERQARDAFLAHYDDFKFLGTITAFPVEQFKKVLEEKGMKGVNLTKDVLSILGGKQ